MIGHFISVLLLLLQCVANQIDYISEEEVAYEKQEGVLAWRGYLFYSSYYYIAIVYYK